MILKFDNFISAIIYIIIYTIAKIGNDDDEDEDESSASGIIIVD